jgi:Flp pilus assembly protein TadG
MRRRLRKIAGEERGDSMVEFALSAIVLFSAIFGILDCSRALFVYHFVSYAAQEGTRYAIVRGSAFSGTSCATTSTLACDATSANITSYVQGLAPPGTGTVTVTPSWPGTQPNGSAGSCTTTGSVDGCLVKVKVSVNFKFILGLMPTSQMTFNGTSENVVQK